jgi:sec-independent protein translocase protein TatA
MLSSFGSTEILIVGGIIVLLFGGAKLSQLGKGLGEGIREFRSSMEPERKAKSETPQNEVRDDVSNASATA